MRLEILIALGGVLMLMLGCQTEPREQNQPGKDDQADYYQEPHRLQYHFSPETQWVNDPNGMVFYENEYHLFYQHYPDSNVWGPMHWGHAISKDLVHWEHLPIALYPDSLGYIFSGSAVVDWKNTGGFGVNDKPPLVAIYTYHDPLGSKAGTLDYQTQGIAYSNDNGRTWIKYEGNPVLNNPGIKDFRDPKVIWSDEFDKWIMVLAVQDHVRFYGSTNLKSWEYLSSFGKTYGGHDGVWECPDLFPMKVVGSEEEKWVLLLNINPGGPNGGSGTQYFVGDFDGKDFRLDPEFKNDVSNFKSVWLDYGRDNYAGVTWSDIPAEDGRRILIGWMSNWDYANLVPTAVWRNAMTLPRELQLNLTKDGYRLHTFPVDELTSLRGEGQSFGELTVAGEHIFNITDELQPIQSELILRLEVPTVDSVQFGIELSNGEGELYRIGFDVASNSFFSDRTQAGDLSFSDKFAKGLHHAPRQIDNKTMELHLFFDRSSVELFADQGATVMSELFFPSQPFEHLKLFADQGILKVLSIEWYSIQRIWDQ